MQNDIGILIVDDEPEIADLVELYLSNENYRVEKCFNGRDALAVIQKKKIDLAILDVMLPDTDGFSLCCKIREEHQFPIIMLTAKSRELDQVNGLSLGADDDITKPFRPLELVARVKAQLRRFLKYNSAGAPLSENSIEISGLVLNKDTRRCSLNEENLELTPIEFSILWYLCEHRGKVVSSEELFQKVWGEKYYTGNNTVMVHIRHLREKMKDSAEHPSYIKTVWGVGYKIEK